MVVQNNPTNYGQGHWLFQIDYYIFTANPKCILMVDLLKLYVKNMVSIRCQMVVKSELEKLGINYTNVGLGEVDIIGKISKDQMYNLAASDHQ